jgi:hypothetical protein
MTFEEWYTKEYDGIGNPKLFAERVWQAATKAALGSRVVLPPRKPDISKTLNPDVEEMISFEGFNECLDLIKLEPINVDEILPSEYENSEAAKRFCQTMEAKSGFLYGVQWLSESIKKRLAGT